jgi:acyl-[acyl-carrier-protein] desaturase
MSVDRVRKQRMYRAYMEFFEIAEKKRRWNVWDDIPWEKIKPELNDEADAIRVETFCGVELYVPDYTAHGFNMTRSIFGQAWFAANWGYEESKHALAFREYLIRSGLRTEDQYLDYEDQILSKVWVSPANTPRQTSIYGAFQEIATYLIYHQQYKKAQREGNEVLQRVVQLTARDEAAHCGFYRKLVHFEMEDDPQGTLEDLADVVTNFRMPGELLIPDYEKRVQIEGVGLTRNQFMAHAILPTLRSFGTDRTELVKTIRAKREREVQEKLKQDLARDCIEIERERERAALAREGRIIEPV